MLPERSLAAKSAKSVLFEEFNDIDIYIEDTAEGYEKIFTELFSRVFSDTYKVSKVFPLGSRMSVVREHEQNCSNFTRPTLYVIDGDLFLMLDNGLASKEGLFVLPCYCIENVLIDIESIHQLLNEENHLKSKDELINEFNYHHWLEGNYRYLLKLFIEYAISFYLLPEIQTVGYQVRELVSSDKGIVDINKVEKRINELMSNVIHQVGNEKYLSTKTTVESIVELNPHNLFIFVSAKDYILPLLITRFKTITKTKMSNINFKLRLAIKCDVKYLYGAKEYVATRQGAMP
jgi:hypothetical protein